MMSRHLSLAALISLIVGAIVLGALSAHVLATKIWLARWSSTEQRAAVLLIAQEADRLIKDEHSRRGQLPAPDFIQQLIQSRWVRDSDIVRISVLLPDRTIIADTDLRQRGARASDRWIAADAADRLGQASDESGNTSYVYRVNSRDGSELCSLVIQLGRRAVQADFYQVIEAMLRLGIPALLIAIVMILGTGVFLARRILVLMGLRVRHRDGEVFDAADQSEDSIAMTATMSRTLGRLDRAVTRLRELANR